MNISIERWVYRMDKEFSMESFINWCDDMKIANEGFSDTKFGKALIAIKKKLIEFFKKAVDFFKKLLRKNFKDKARVNDDIKECEESIKNLNSVSDSDLTGDVDKSAFKVIRSAEALMKKIEKEIEQTNKEFERTKASIDATKDRIMERHNNFNEYIKQANIKLDDGHNNFEETRQEVDAKLKQLKEDNAKFEKTHQEISEMQDEISNALDKLLENNYKKIVDTAKQVIRENSGQIKQKQKEFDDLVSSLDVDIDDMIKNI
jgi:chromosome segregation ATPase